MVIIISLLVALDFSALRWGVDSRDGSMDPRSPVRPQ